MIARMEEIDAELDPRDGLACFNRVYLKVTRLVKEHIAEGTFKDPEFLGRMDVLFAGLYLRNVEAAKAGRPVDPSWQPLLEHRANRVVWPVQFALAGMNAHIDHDLAVAVVETCKERHTTPRTPPVHEDYEKVNDLLAGVEAEIRAEFELQIVKVATKPAEDLKHFVSAFSISSAREIAWVNANQLWIAGPLYASRLAAISAGVAATGEMILTPVVPPARRLNHPLPREAGTARHRPRGPGRAVPEAGRPCWFRSEARWIRFAGARLRGTSPNRPSPTGSTSPATSRRPLPDPGTRRSRRGRTRFSGRPARPRCAVPPWW
ncbi:DUF5995 family protein [Kitasatospora cineracea]|uniref:DUF5995 family protein n=1 Tax=Kitasatospora cineracea TaxID=88074 RepID=UPI0013C3396F|nr:DUF5995 family protein [Kitasatospora cineracea]